MNPRTLKLMDLVCCLVCCLSSQGEKGGSLLKFFELEWCSRDMKRKIGGKFYSSLLPSLKMSSPHKFYNKTAANAPPSLLLSGLRIPR